jgi:hypothetical protein
VRSSRLLLSVLLTVAVLGCVPAAASARVPQGFVGMMADGELLFSPHVNLGRQLDSMVASGVESLRVVFNWGAAEPYARWSEVPAAQRHRFTNVGNMPIDFSAMDRIVGPAAQRGLSLLPVILFAPQWAAAPGTLSGVYAIPASPATFGQFAAALAKRYGPHGSYWRGHPHARAVPIRMWQIWNEPNLTLYWPAADFPGGYVDLVHAAHDAIRGVDPGARIVLAGMPNDSWNSLAQIYSVPGASRYFDVVAVHPFTKQPAGVITILQMVRDAMDRAGDTRKPIIASEVSFPSAVGKTAPSQLFGFETNEAGQAANLRALLPLLSAARNRLHLLGFYHYNWIGREHSGDKPFSFAGLLRLTGRRLVAKPAFAAFRTAALAIEGCRVKAPLATRCTKH